MTTSYLSLEKMENTFTALSAQALDRFDEKAGKGIATLLEPIRENLEKVHKEVNEMENVRQRAFGDLDRHLKTLFETQQALHRETGKLSSALRHPGITGQWGENQLRNLVQLSGMQKHWSAFEVSQVTGPGDNFLAGVTSFFKTDAIR